MKPNLIACKDHRFELHHMIRIYDVYEDPNTDKMQRHVFHDYVVRCSKCGTQHQVFSVIADQEPIISVSKEEFAEIVADYKPLERGDN